MTVTTFTPSALLENNPDTTFQPVTLSNPNAPYLMFTNLTVRPLLLELVGQLATNTINTDNWSNHTFGITQDKEKHWNGRLFDPTETTPRIYVKMTIDTTKKYFKAKSNIKLVPGAPPKTLYAGIPMIVHCSVGGWFNKGMKRFGMNFAATNVVFPGLEDEKKQE
ncbi:hypothetical protein BC832DRAFT_595948 [Gaertneriomyces semiglobifer]|nr:hypothetical protein BC832DRAFT_595948 [Gaertneriomyces semiglobifer]